MDTLDRFLLRDFLIYFVLVLLGVAFLFLGIDFLSKVWGENMALSQMLKLYGYKLPAALQQFLPVACLLASLLVLSSMSRQNEILALYSSGIGAFRLVSTFVAIVATISTFAFVTFDAVVPLFTKKEILVKRGLDPSQEHLLLTFGSAGFWYRSGSVIYNVGQYRHDTNRLEDLRVYLLNKDFKLTKTLSAKRATYEGGDWVLEDGFEVAYPLDSGFPIPKKFEKMSGIIPEKPADFKTFKVEDQTMRLRDLRRYINRNASYGWDTTVQRVNYHERLALVFAPLVFVLMGIPFAIKPLKTQSVSKSIGLCFLLVFLYLLFFRLSLSMGKGGQIPAVIAGWAPNLIFLGAGAAILMRR